MFLLFVAWPAKGSAFIFSGEAPDAPASVCGKHCSASGWSWGSGGRARQVNGRGNGSGTLQGRGPLGQALGPH